MDAADLIEVRPLQAPIADAELYEITYYSQSYKVKGYYMKPLKRRDGKTFPGLVYCRGGYRHFGMVKIEQITPFVKRGYAVFAPFYRGNFGGEGRDEFAGADRHDVFAAIRLLASFSTTSNRPIALVGFSRGAMMAFLAARHCEQVGAVISWNGVSNLLLTYEERNDLRRMLKRVVGHPGKQRGNYVDRSPIFWADKLNVPVHIVHGVNDDHVSVQHAYLLSDALTGASIEHAMTICDQEGHHFSDERKERLYDELCEWLQQIDEQNAAYSSRNGEAMMEAEGNQA